MNPRNLRIIELLEKLTRYFMLLFPFYIVIALLFLAFLIYSGAVSGYIELIALLTILKGISMNILGIFKMIIKKLTENI